MESQALPQGVNPEYVILIDGVYYDLCVNPDCKVNTSVRTDCPVDQRRHYVDGSSQLCKKCFEGLQRM